MTLVPPPYPDPALVNANVDASGVVVVDAPCRKCGYNLRGLNVAGRCPECAAAVGLSAHGDLLRYSDPAWVRTLQRGVRCIIAALAVFILGLIAAMLLSAVLGPMALVGVALVGVIAYCLVFIGSWLLTSRDPSGVGEDQYGTSRKIIRISLLVGVGSTLLKLLPLAVTLPPPARIAIEAINLIGALVGVVGLFAQLDYLGKLANRIPDAALVSRAKFLKSVFAPSYALIVLMQGVAALIQWSSGPASLGSGLQGLVCFTGLLSLAVLVFAIMYLIMLEKMGKRFGEQAVVAEMSWARTEAAAAVAPLPIA